MARAVRPALERYAEREQFLDAQVNQRYWSDSCVEPLIDEPRVAFGAGIPEMIPDCVITAPLEQGVKPKLDEKLRRAFSQFGSLVSGHGPTRRH